MKSLKHIVIFLSCLLIAGVLLGFAAEKSSEALCEGFEVELLGDADVHFVSQTSLVQYLYDHGHSVTGDRIEHVDTHTMEEDLMQIPFVESVEVFKTIDHKVKVKVVQRKPVMRLFFDNGSSLYVDDKGGYMQTSESYSHKCLPVTGLSAASISEMTGQKLKEGTGLHKLWNMASYINQDSFWKAQIMQVDMEKGKGAVLTPRVGNHEIVMGSPDNFIKKLDKLRAFYDKGIEQTNWNIYKKLDLRYEGQVVAEKR